MEYRWANGAVPLHLEGECRNLEKLTIEIYGVELVGMDGTTPILQATRNPLPFHHAESCSDGVMRIYIEMRKE